MSFRQFGGMNYAPRHNIVASNYNTSNNLLVTQNVGQPNSYINFQSDISGNINIFGDLDVSGNVYANEFYITGPLATEPNSVVPKSYVDAIGSGLRPLPFCILCSNAGPITLSGNTQTIDGVTLNSSYNGEAILVNAQGGVGNNNINNGIYIIGSGAWSRASYLDTGDIATGTVTTIQSGLTYATYRFVCAVGTTSSPVNIGSPVVWSPYEIPFTLGQGLNRALVGNTTVLSVDSSLNFLTLVDASSSFPTLNIGTENALTITMGKLNGSTNTNINGNTNIGGTLSTSGLATLNSASITNNASIGGTLTVSGLVTASSFNALSDYRIKENIEILNENYNVDNLTPITYLNNKTGKQDIGLLAHEVQEYLPCLVNGVKDAEELQSVNYTGLIPILIKEIQELKKEIKLLKENIKENI
jgi:hypothetical protein